tara:strand:- start:711 stop:2024 length:1314 start_codon:yes stop_codon:yes gene_type:complete
MPIIYTYPQATPALEDLVIISDASETNPAKATRQCTISDILAMGAGEDYDLNAGAKVGAYVPLNLTSTSGTDNSVVKLTEGNNITLTRNSATEITIDAAGGGGGTMSQWYVRDDDNDDGTVTGSNNFVKFEAATGTLGTNITGTGTTLDPFVMTITSPDTDTTYSAMDTTTLGLGKLRYTRGATPAAEAQSVTASRTYGITDNTSNQLVVNVPWTDTDTTYSKATDAVLGLVKLEDNAVQTTAANAITTTASRTYGIQFNASDQLVVNVPWTDSDGGTFNGWDVLNFAQGETMSANATILYFYQVVVPEPFTANKAKLYVTVASGASTFAVSIYSGLLSNLAGTTKLGDGTINPTATGIVEVPLTQVSPGDLDLTAGQNIILGFSQSIGDKMLCINNRIADSNLAISSVTALPFPSTLSGLEEPATSVLRPCCVLYK